MNAFLESWNSFKGTVRGFDTPHQLGLGMTFGVIVGLLPKDSLLPYAIGMIAILTTANLLCFGIGVVLAAIASPNFDGLSHPIGQWFLTFDPIESSLAVLYNLPVLPWTRFNNTVVMGSLILGIAIAPVVYGSTRWTCSRISKQFNQHWKNWRFASFKAQQLQES
jgi:uncharacterized protein (TIGR03546 family)